MPYVQRTDGVVTGVFAVPQEGYAEEFLTDDDAEVAAFRYKTPTVDDQIAALDTEFDRKKTAIVMRKSTAELAGGVGVAAKVSAIQAEYAALVAEYNAAVDVLLFS